MAACFGTLVTKTQAHFGSFGLKRTAVQHIELAAQHDSVWLQERGSSGASGGWGRRRTVSLTPPPPPAHNISSFQYKFVILNTNFIIFDTKFIAFEMHNLSGRTFCVFGSISDQIGCALES